MLSFAYVPGKYYICPGPNENYYSNQAWTVVSKVNKNRYGFKGVLLKPGQVVKFGRYVFKINEISTDMNNKLGIHSSANQLDTDRKQSKIGSTKSIADYAKNGDDHKHSDQRHANKTSKLSSITEEGNKDAV